MDKTVIDVFGQCLEKMRKVFLAPDGQPLVVAGSGTLGWDMVGANLVNKGDDVLIVNNGALSSQQLQKDTEEIANADNRGYDTMCAGYFGDNLADCLERYGAKTTHVRGKVRRTQYYWCCM